jgi:hypothetical protein
MQSTQDAKNDPRDVLEIAPDVVLVARAATDFPSLAPAAAGQPYDRQPNMESGFAAAHAPEVDTTFRASDVNDGVRPSRGRWIRTASVAFLLALASAFATAAWERYGDEAQAMVADFTPRSIIPDLGSWLPLQRDAAATPPDNAAPQPVAADQAPATPPAPVALATDSAAPPQAALPADSAQTLQSMSRDVASLTQQISELKASIAQLKAAQEQLSRDMAGRVAEARPVEPRVAEPRPKQLGAPPRPLGTIVQHKPKPVAYPPAQAATAPLPPPPAAPPPVQLAPAQPDGDPVVRPPMPVR